MAGTNRRLTESQRSMVAARYQEALKPAGKEKQRQAGKEHGRGQKKLPVNLPEANGTDTRDEAAKLLNVSGKSVSKAKRLLGHGKFGAWLEEHFEGTKQMARIYARLACNRQVLEQKGKSIFGLGIAEADKLIREQKREPAATHYCQAARMGVEAVNLAAEARLRAERRAGELLAGTDLHKGGRPSENRFHDGTSLSDLGIDKTQSHRWQAIAIPTRPARLDSRPPDSKPRRRGFDFGRPGEA